ncbi:MAG: hypothetical protein COW67_01025, partial [Flavobacteriales bacterium CG18_big_fil_WC_8_21_14_2_50_32_9]
MFVLIEKTLNLSSFLIFKITMNKITFSTLLLATIILFSCETKVDINADYKDITVVHAAIDPNDTEHYVKINHAFLEDGVSATNLAANS